MEFSTAVSFYFFSFYFWALGSLRVPNVCVDIIQKL